MTTRICYPVSRSTLIKKPPNKQPMERVIITLKLKLAEARLLYNALGDQSDLREVRKRLLGAIEGVGPKPRVAVRAPADLHVGDKCLRVVRSRFHELSLLKVDLVEISMITRNGYVYAGHDKFRNSQGVWPLSQCRPRAHGAGQYRVSLEPDTPERRAQLKAENPKVLP